MDNIKTEIANKDNDESSIKESSKFNLNNFYVVKNATELNVSKIKLKRKSRSPANNEKSHSRIKKQKSRLISTIPRVI